MRTWGAIRNWFLGVALAIFARFEGATWSPSRSHIPTTRQSARFDAGSAPRGILVGKSRYFEKNNGIMQRAVSLFECYTVGCGLQLTPASSSPEWNKKAKAWLDEWSLYPDIASRQSFGKLQSLIARTWFIDGEVFIVFTRGATGKPRLQLVEEHLVSTPPTLAHREGIDIFDGIQVNKEGRPIAYYIAEEDGRGKKTWGNPIPADFVEHLFDPSRPGQMRGLPYCYAVINELHDLDDLHILEMKAAKKAAKTSEVIKTKTGELKSTPAILRDRITQTGTISTGTSVTENKVTHYKESIGEETIVLESGDEYNQHESKRPSVVTMDYWRYKTELVCAGFEIPYILLFPNADMQGTVYRGALDMANAFFNARSMVIQDALRRIYQFHVMPWARFNVPELRPAPEDWMKVTILPPRGCNVDVGHNSAAMLAELAVGATNFERIYAPLGADWKEELTKLNEQLAHAEDIGLLDRLAKLAGAQKPKPEPGANGNGHLDDPPPRKKPKNRMEIEFL